MSELVVRAEHGCELLQAAYDWKLDDRPGVTVLSRCNAFGIQARLIVDTDGSTALVIPGTGYSEKGTANEKRLDWQRNLRSAFGMPRLGQSGRFFWPAGFLEQADLIDDWLRDQLDGRHEFRTIDYAYGHSQGAGALQPLVWSNAELFQEAHAVASPLSCFSVAAAICLKIHVWNAPDDPVTWLPPFSIPTLRQPIPMRGRHVGLVYTLPKNNRRHRVSSYSERLAMLRRVREAA